MTSVQILDDQKNNSLLIIHRSSLPKKTILLLLLHRICKQPNTSGDPTIRRVTTCCLSLLLTCGGLSSVAAQDLPSEAASSTAQFVAPVLSREDTLPLFFFRLAAPERYEAADDTLPSPQFRMYDPARQRLIDWATLGNLGSSARPLWFEPTSRVGFATGIRPFDLYRQRPEDLRFFRHARTFSEVTFTRGLTQRQSNSRAVLSRTFSGGLNFAVDYQTINNLSQFRWAQTKHGTLSVGVWHPVSRRYEYFLTYTANTFRQRDNGGVYASTAILDEFFDGPISLDITLEGEEARSIQRDQTLLWKQFLKFTTEQKRTFQATHTLRMGRESWKYSDPKQASSDGTLPIRDSIFYQYLFNDRRGLRHVLNVRSLDNTLTISTFKIKNSGSPTDGFSAGLRHVLYDVGYEGRGDSLVQNTFALGHFSLTPSARFEFGVRGDLGLLRNTGEYRVEGNLRLGLGRAGVLEGRLLSQRRPADLLHTQLWVSQRSVWDFGVQKPVENSLSATYALPLIGFSATGQTHVVNNFLYYDQTYRPRQLGAALSVSQLLFRENFHLGPFHMANTVAFQTSNQRDVLRLPTWFLKNSAYLQGRIVKGRMLANAGVDFRMNSEFRPDGYMPLTGQFHLQDSLTQRPYLWLDAFVSLKIESFRFFLRVENLATNWQSRELLYLTAQHPQVYGRGAGGLRIGLTWRFLDSNQDTGEDASNGNQPPPGVGGGRPPF
jgi:hypothetical protein